MSDRTSSQPLGDATVLVEYEQHTDNGKPQCVVCGAYVNNDFVSASCFSEGQLRMWELSILIEEVSA